MFKNNKQVKNLLLVLLLLISPILWIVLGNIPTEFSNTQSWLYISTFAILAFAVYLALDSGKK
jgi:uncharacterized membrane protein